SYSPLSKQSICLCTICPFFEVLNIAFSPPFNSISLLHPLILADNSSQASAFRYTSINSALFSSSCTPSKNCRIYSIFSYLTLLTTFRNNRFSDQIQTLPH